MIRKQLPSCSELFFRGINPYTRQPLTNTQVSEPVDTVVLGGALSPRLSFSLTSEIAPFPRYLYSQRVDNPLLTPAIPRHQFIVRGGR